MLHDAILSIFPVDSSMLHVNFYFTALISVVYCHSLSQVFACYYQYSIFGLSGDLIKRQVLVEAGSVTPCCL